MNKLLSRITTPLLGRVVIFLGLFVLISGLIGSKIVSSDILFRDGFGIYGGPGKAVIFGLIAFLLLVRHKGLELKLLPWRPILLGWLTVAFWLCVVAWVSVDNLIAGDRTTQNIALAHGGLIFGVVCAAIATFGPKNLLLLWQAYKRELLLAAAIAGFFYVFLLGVYALWRPLASIVLVCVHALLTLSGLTTDLILPNVLVTDKFGITIAEYCSGIESIALFSGLYIIVGLLDRDRLNLKRFLLLFPLALTILFGLNILRVFALIMAGYHINAQIAFSLFHSYAGMIFFILYSAVFWSIAYKYVVKRPGPPKPPTKGSASPKNIIISHVYSSKNKGDAALTSVLIQDLKRKFKHANITILRLESVKEKAKFEGVPEQPSFMSLALHKYRNPLLKLPYTLYMLSATLLWAAWLRTTGRHLYLPKQLREIAQSYEQADLIVPVGGGYIRSRAGLLNRFNIPLLLHPLLLGYLLGKPTILYSQSVGPFQNKFERWLVAFVLKRMDLILLREDTSVKLLASLGVSSNVTRAIDSGFLLRSSTKIDVRKTYNIPADALLVGVTVRAWLEDGAQAAYEQAVAKALDGLVETTGAHILFIPQVTATNGDDDRLISQRVAELMLHAESTTLINSTPSHRRIKAIYDNLDILLGTRFHSVIFSLTSHVPVVAIEYEHKTSGIMHDLGLDEWVIKIEDVSSRNLGEALQRLVLEQHHYRDHLAKCLPPYVQQAEQTVDLLAQSYAKTQAITA